MDFYCGQITFRQCRDEGLFLAFGVVGDQLVGEREYLRGASEVFLEFDDNRIGPIALESEDIADIGAAPFVNGLVGIACHADISMLQSYAFCDLVLGMIGVLILIDEQVSEAVADLFANIGAVPQQKGCPGQQIVKVQRVVVLKNLLLLPVDLCENLVVVIVGTGGESFDIFEVVFEPGY